MNIIRFFKLQKRTKCYMDKKGNVMHSEQTQRISIETRVSNCSLSYATQLIYTVYTTTFTNPTFVFTLVLFA